MSADIVPKDEYGSDSLPELLFDFQFKCASIVIGNRLSNLDSNYTTNTKFGIPTSITDDDNVKLQQWHFSNVEAVQPLIVETFLDLRGIHSKQKLYLLDNQGQSWFVAKSSAGDKTKLEVVLERWIFEYINVDAKEDAEVAAVAGDAAAIGDNNNIREEGVSDYAKISGFLREINKAAFKFPMCQLAKDIAAYAAGKQTSNRCLQNLKIKSRLYSAGKISSKRRVGLSKAIIDSPGRSHIQHISFDPVTLSHGVLNVSVDARKDTDFFLNRHISSDLEESTPTNASKSVIKRSPDVNSKLEHSPSPAPEEISRGIPINRSGSNVSLAALLRSAKNNNSFNVGSYNTPGSFPRSYSSSHNGSLISNINVAAAINPVQDPSLSQTKYTSSFGSRHQLPWSNRKSLVSSGHGKFRASGEGRNSLDGESISGDDGLNEFLHMVENKRELRVSPMTHSTNLGDSLLRYKSMKVNNFLEESPSQDRSTGFRNAMARSPSITSNPRYSYSPHSNLREPYESPRFSSVMNKSNTSNSALQSPYHVRQKSGSYVYNNSPSPPEDILQSPIQSYNKGSPAINIPMARPIAKNYDIGSAPLPITSKMDTNQVSNAYSYTVNDNSGLGIAKSQAFDTKVINNRYNPRHGERRLSSGLRPPSLQIRSPSLAATNTTNAYADRIVARQEGEQELVNHEMVSDLAVDADIDMEDYI